ncbi:MAG: AAA family ATPase, partial [Methylobacter sp.]|nr:AAA family ATPase [Methylobacter sp.]MDP3361061.1 AAA family ATPase [Methylobacter sp.]
MARKKLPIGIQTFAKIREDHYYYVDKTPLILKLVSDGTHYFLSRPRRFGKSLLIDTLGELFAGNEPLFRGLFIHDKWDWSIKYPVIRLSFGGG